MLSVPSGRLACKVAKPCANPVVLFTPGDTKAVPGSCALPLKKATEPEGALPLLVVSTIAFNDTGDPEGNVVPLVCTVVVVAALVIVKADAGEVLESKLASPK